MNSYKSKFCDLCGSFESTTLLSLPGNDSMTSDQKVFKRRLKKICCNYCGLIREGNDFDFKDLDEHYKKNYSLNTHSENMEHMFFKDGEMISRSFAIAKWISELIEESKIPIPKSIFEIGAGQGNLIEQLQKMFSNVSFSGCEINEPAVGLAVEKGIDIIQGGVSEIPGRYNMIIAFGVLEHVPSPTQFLDGLKQHLLPGGYLILGQPMQDVGSYDVFFSDHLHHFHTTHLQYYADKAGFKQIANSLSPWFANNFSLHLLELSADETIKEIQYVNPEKVIVSVDKWKKTFHKIEKLKNPFPRKFAVYGLSEIATLLFCYSGLRNLPIAFGIDDFPERCQKNVFNVEVKCFSDLTKKETDEISNIIPALNPMYLKHITEKCNAIGLPVINIYEDNLNIADQAKHNG